MKQFAELGALIESRWRESNYDENAFPGIAAHALSEARLCERVDPLDVIRWVHRTTDFPEQMDPVGMFGNPPITLFSGPRFYIDIYYWLDGSTTIHQHAFSGAFQLLLGSSVQAHYRFANVREINPHFLTGKLLLNDVALLSQRDIREIHPGPEFIHSVFHLDRPSATVTIRTHKAPRAAVQYSYLKPFLAINPFFEESSLKKKVQTVSLLLRMKHPEADQIIAELLDSSDFHTAYAVLAEAFDFLCHRELEEIVGVTRSRDRFEALLSCTRTKHGELADLLVPVYEEEWRQNEISRRRTEIKSEEHRFFLAMLLNVPQRTDVLRLIKEKTPDKDPIDLIVGWVKELGATKTFGSREGNVLGLQDLDDGYLFVLRGLLEGLTIREIEARRAAAGPDAITNSKSSIGVIANRITALPLFKSIFAE